MEKRAHVKCVCSSANSRAAFVALRQWVATACYYYLRNQKPERARSGFPAATNPPCLLRANLAANAPNNQPLNGKTGNETVLKWVHRCVMSNTSHSGRTESLSTCDADEQLQFERFFWELFHIIYNCPSTVWPLLHVPVVACRSVQLFVVAAECEFAVPLQMPLLLHLFSHVLQLHTYLQFSTIAGDGEQVTNPHSPQSAAAKRFTPQPPLLQLTAQCGNRRAAINTALMPGRSSGE